MRVLRVLLALLLGSGPVQAQPVVDLLSRYTIPADESAASAPEGDAPQGSGKRLAALESDLALVSESLEGFAHPQDADKALLAAKPRLPAGTAPFFKDRTMALGALYRTLAVVDYTWALRFPDPPCAPAAKRSALLRSDDGLFLDPFSGKTSPWMTALLGPNAKGKDLESALDQASASVTPSEAEYARLRARQNLITKALASEDAVGEARAKLYCKRAETRVKLAAANRAVGPMLAARSSREESSRRGLILLAGKTAEGLEVRGAGVVLETKSGIRVLTDRRLGAGEVVALLDGRSAPVPLSVDREDERSGLLLLRPDGDLGEALVLADAAPKKDDLVFAFAHSDRLGAWTKTQGLVTSAGPDQFQTDAVADASMTGGAVLNEEGRVVGLLVLRPVAGSTIDWPAAVPTHILLEWLDGGVAPAALPVDLADQGTTKILTASMPLLQSVSVGDGATTAGYGFDTQTQWGSVHAKCMANCGDSSPSSSYSGNANAELGEALGKLAVIGAEALIFKGVPALFRGIGSLFKSKPRRNEAQAATIDREPIQIQEIRVEPPKPEPPKPECSFEPVNPPKTIGVEPVEIKMRFSCKNVEGVPKVRLGGHKVIFRVGWEGLPQSTFTIPTDDEGYAPLPIAIQGVEVASQKAHDALDNYDPDKTRTSAAPPAEDSHGGATAATSDLVNAASLTAPAPVAEVVTEIGTKGTATRTVFIIGRTHTVRATILMIVAELALDVTAVSGIVLTGSVLATMYVSWKIGGGVNQIINGIDYKLRHPSAPAMTSQYEDKFDELGKEEGEFSDAGDDHPPVGSGIPEDYANPQRLHPQTPVKIIEDPNEKTPAPAASGGGARGPDRGRGIRRPPPNAICSNVPLNRASTGRKIPSNDVEKNALARVLADPLAGAIILPVPITDKRWPEKGWSKMARHVDGVQIHFLWNSVTGEVDDFKFK